MGAATISTPGEATGLRTPAGRPEPAAPPGSGRPVDHLVPGSRVPLPDRGDRVVFVPLDLAGLPRRRLVATERHPGGLPGGPVGDVLPRRRDQHRAAEDLRGDPAYRLGRGAAA